MYSFKKEDIFKAALFMSMLILLGIGVMLGLTAASTILVKRLGVDYLPYNYIVLSLINILGSTVYLVYADKIKRVQLLNILLLFSGGVLLVARLLITNASHGSFGVLSWDLVFFFLLIYVVQGFSTAALNTQIWSTINDSYRPAIGKKVYPIFSLCWLIGGMLGGLLVHVLVPLVGVGNLIFAWAFCLFATIPLAMLLDRKFGGGMRWRPVEAAGASKGFIAYINANSEVWHYIRKSPVALYIVCICFCSYIVSSAQDFQYTQVMNATFHTEASLSKFYGTYSIVWYSTAIFLQLFVAEKLLVNIGVFRGFAALPLATLIAFVLLMIQFSFWEGVWLRYSWNVVGTMLFANAYQLSFNVFPAHIRGRLRGFCGGIASPLGALVGGMLLLVFQQSSFLSSSSASYLFPSILGSIVCVYWLYLVWRGRKAYIDNLIDNLHIEEQPKLLDALESMEERREPLVTVALTDMLLKPSKTIDTEVKSKVMDVLSRLGNVTSLRPLSLFLKDPNPVLRGQAIASMVAFKALKRNFFALHYLLNEMEYLLNHDPSSIVRLEAGKFLLHFYPTHELPRLVAKLLDHAEGPMRMMTMQTILALNVEMIDMMVVPKLKDPDPAVRCEATIVLWKYPDYRKQIQEVLNRLLNAPSPLEQRYGLIALLRLEGAKEQLTSVEPLMSSTEFINRSLACVIMLSTMIPESDEWNQVLTNLFGILAEPHFEGDERQVFVAMLPYVNDSVVDAILWGTQQLTPEKRQMAMRGLENLATLMYEKIMDE